jgi:beta-galactosidase/beta-glucuronidase
VTASRSAVEITDSWRFLIDVPDVGEKENWQATTFDRSKWTKVEVPKAWDLFDEALWGYEGVGWYSTELAAGLTTNGKVQRLKFGRVNYHAKVWLNGEFLGENVNGYLPFEFDVTGRLKPGAANQLVVRVDNAAKLAWLPGAKKIEWMLYGGILEPVVLETVSSVYISDLTVRAVPKGAGAMVNGTVEVTSRASEAAEITLRTCILGQSGPPSHTKIMIAPGTKAERTFSITLPKADLWSRRNRISTH